MRTVFLKIKEGATSDIIVFHDRVFAAAEHYANKNNLTWEYIGVVFSGDDFLQGRCRIELSFTPID